MEQTTIYKERISSGWTPALFAALTALFLVLSLWRVVAVAFDTLAAVFLFLSVFFLFYTLNYRTLMIHLSEASLKLRFGIFTLTIPLDNVAVCRQDDLPTLLKYGGAGIHFMFVHGTYRASFNFLEHPRVAVVLQKPLGPVEVISFSTAHPNKLIELLMLQLHKQNAPTATHAPAGQEHATL